MQYWSAFILGLVGGLHCAGMCGPLIMAAPATGKTRLGFALGRAAYNLGRIATYCLLGALFGAIGMTFAFAGLQRWVSISAGVAIIAGLFASPRFTLMAPVSKGVAVMRSSLAKLLKRRTFGSIFLLGVLNGFLPCGLVYVACAGAVAMGSFQSGWLYMLLFGLGTAPMMMTVGLVGSIIPIRARLQAQKLTLVWLVIVGGLLILRGMSLGIPYVSPVLGASPLHGASCH